MEQGQNPELTALSGIPARSRKQAMDWSLVLASQDIHPVITQSPETNGWMLLVAPAEVERAIQAIKLYRVENRGWSWRRELPGSDLEVHWGVVVWCVALAMIHWAATFVVPEMDLRGQMNSELVRAGAWHRLFTAVLLHGDLAHLLANISFGLLILGLAMARFGWGMALLVTFLAGAAGNLLGLSFYSKYRGLGASGMMMGALGLLCIHSIGLWRKSPKAARYILSGILAGLFLFIMFGVNPDPSTDILAHLGGFIAGLFAGGLLGFVPEKKLLRPLVNYFAFTMLIGLIIWTWFLAFTR